MIPKTKTKGKMNGITKANALTNTPINNVIITPEPIEYNFMIPPQV